MTALTQAPPPSEGVAQQKARTRKDKRLVAALIALLAAGAAGFGLLVGVRGALAAWGLSEEVALWLAELVTSKSPTVDLGLGPPGPMEILEARQARAWSAIYTLSAAERLHTARDVIHAEQVERGYFARHLGAEERRQRAAALVDLTSRLLGDRREEQSGPPLLGWRAVIDAKTTPECRWANGMNFRADRLPLIGVPGSVHPRCRCTSGPPIPGAPLIPSA